MLWICGAGLALVIGTLVLGGYFAGSAGSFTAAPNRPRPALAAVFWSGDMGLLVGFGSDLPERLANRGIPVLAISSPALFGEARDGAFARAAVARSLQQAIRRSGARKVALVGFSFGADVLAASVGELAPGLRARIASIVLVGPGSGVHFHANPFGIFYTGTPDADSAHMADALRGLPVSCIFAASEDESLCREPRLAGARVLSVPGGHLMLAHRQEVTEDVIEAVLNPARPLR